MVTTALDIRDSRMVTAKCLILDTKSILYFASAATCVVAFCMGI